MDNTTQHPVLSAAAYVAVSQLSGALNPFVTTRNIRGWYRGLERPSWTPPDAVFGPVWTFLYFCIGLAGWRASRGHDRPLRLLWLAQFALNATWSPTFFGLHRLGLAAANIGVMWSSILAFVLRARDRDPFAAWLFAPYLAWVTYASVLNMQIWRRNRAR